MEKPPSPAYGRYDTQEGEKPEAPILAFGGSLPQERIAENDV